MARFIVARTSAATFTKKIDVFNDGSVTKVKTVFNFESLDLSSSAIHSCLIHFLVGGQGRYSILSWNYYGLQIVKLAAVLKY